MCVWCGRNKPLYIEKYNAYQKYHKMISILYYCSTCKYKNTFASRCLLYFVNVCLRICVEEGSHIILPYPTTHNLHNKFVKDVLFSIRFSFKYQTKNSNQRKTKHVSMTTPTGNHFPSFLINIITIAAH